MRALAGFDCTLSNLPPSMKEYPRGTLRIAVDIIMMAGCWILAGCQVLQAYNASQVALELELGALVERAIHLSHDLEGSANYDLRAVLGPDAYMQLIIDGRISVIESRALHPEPKASGATRLVEYGPAPIVVARASRGGHVRFSFIRSGSEIGRVNSARQAAEFLNQL